MLRSRLGKSFFVSSLLIFLPLLSLLGQEPELEFSFYLGGEFDDFGSAIAMDATGASYVALTIGQRLVSLPNRSVIVPECQPGIGPTLTCPGFSPEAIRNVLVIKLDPSGRLVYSTFLGGTGRDVVNDIVVDASGNVFVTGRTEAFDFPVTPVTPDPRTNRIQPAMAGGESDVFVVKLDTDGGIMAATFLGGGDEDEGHSLTVSPNGDILLAGTTSSTDFPAKALLTLPNVPTEGLDYRGGASDGFAAHLSADLRSLAWSRFIGGSGRDELNGSAVTPGGSYFLVGETESMDLNTDANSVQGAFGGGASDGFITHINQFGVETGISYLGGSEMDISSAAAASSGGSLVVVGVTESSDFPSTPGVIQTTKSGGTDGYVSTFDISGNALQRSASTFLGGTGNDGLRDVTVDPSAQLVVVGETRSANMPVSSNAFQPDFNTLIDAYIARLLPDASGVAFASYLGGNGIDRGRSTAADPSGVIVLTGWTNSDDLPLPDHITDNLTGGGVSSDAFVAKLTPPGQLPADVQIEKSASSDTVNIGEQFTYTLTVTNAAGNLSNVANNIVVIDTIPLRTSFVSVTSSGASCSQVSALAIRCTRAQLAIGDSFEITITVTAQSDGQVTNRARVSTSSRDHVLFNNRVELTTTILPHLTLRLSRSAEITQGIQDLGNHVPLVERKRTVVRVYPEARRGSAFAEANNLTSRLFGTHLVNGQEQDLPGSPLTPDNGSIDLPATGPNRGVDTLSFNYTLPYSWTFNEINLTATLGGTIPDDIDVTIASVDDNGNLTQTQTIQFWEVSPVCMRTYRVDTPNGPLATNYLLTDPDGRAMRGFATDLLPTNQIAVFPRSQLLAHPVLGRRYFDSVSDTIDSGLLILQLWTIDQTSNDPNGCDNANARTHYVAPIHELDAPWGGTARMGGDQLWFDAEDAAPGNASPVGGDAINTPLGGRTLAHELGHNYSRQHINCACTANNPANTDPNYPFPACSFAQVGANAFFGFHTRNPTAIPAGVSDSAGNSVGDLMSYSCTRWPSSYFWTKTFFNFRCQFRNFCHIPDPQIMSIARGTGPLPVIQPLVAAEPELPDRILLGRALYREQTAQLDGYLQFALSSELIPEAKARALLGEVDDGSELRVELRDETGTPVITRGLVRYPLADQPEGAGWEMIAFAVPASADVRTVLVMREDEVLERQTVSETPPIIDLVSPRGGQELDDLVRVSWEASDQDGDTLSYFVQYSRDGGDSWETLAPNLRETSTRLDLSTIGGADQEAMIRVLATDGFHTASATSQPFSVADMPPILFINRPASGSSFKGDASITAEGNAFDPEDGYLDASVLSWTLNDTTELESGPRISVGQLPAGQHRLTLTAHDSQGQEVSESVEFTVGERDETDELRTGFVGRVFTRLPGGEVGDPLSGVQIVFRSEDGEVVRTTVSASNGSYRVGLPPGRYVVNASHPGFERFSSAPGFFVVQHEGFQTANIFLRVQ